MAHLYIHIPFCLSKCAYCSFVSFPGKEYLFDRYTRAIEKELKLISQKFTSDRLDTIFFGGGTPSLLPLENISDILKTCRDFFLIDKAAEISMEVNPKSVDFQKLLILKDLGINRLSVGVQSFINDELQFLGRLHTAQQAWETVESAKKSGYKNVSIDLMFGLPGQTSNHWRWSLQTAIDLLPEHLSLYQLTLEEGTELQVRIKRGDATLPEENEILAMDRVTAELCSTAGFSHYEISNFSQPGFSCRHNINYWKNKEYYAVGAGAVRYLAGERVRNVEDPEKYCGMMEQGETAVFESEKLSNEASFRETVVMGLRMTEGVSVKELFDRYGIDLREYYGKTLEKLITSMLLDMDTFRLRLTPRGRAVANRVMADLV